VQKEIIAILDASIKIRNKREDIDKKMTTLSPALFYQMFGDPSSNEMGWEVRRLSDVCNFIGGGTPSKSNPDFWKGDIPWVSPKDMTSSLIDQAEDYITERAIKESATSLVPSGTILIVTRSGILKRILPIALTGRAVTINQDLKALVINDSTVANVVFIYQQLACRAQEILSSIKSGVTVQSIDTSFLKNLLVIIPPIDLQNKFAECESRAKEIGMRQRACRDLLTTEFDSLRHRLL
jgi:type I restriction enzyme S subunit